MGPSWGSRYGTSVQDTALAERTYAGGEDGAIFGTRAERCLGSPHTCWFLEALWRTVDRARRTGMNKQIWGRANRGGKLGLVKANVCFRRYSDEHNL